jgi:hypothetical protein
MVSRALRTYAFVNIEGKVNLIPFGNELFNVCSIATRVSMFDASLAAEI